MSLSVRTLKPVISQSTHTSRSFTGRTLVARSDSGCLARVLRGGATGSNYSLTGTLGLASNVSLDLTLGNTSGDGGSAPYLGVMLAVGL